MQATLATGLDFDGFRLAARGLLARGVRPEDAQWGGDLFAQDSAPDDAVSAAQRVPAFFVDLCRTVILHRDPQRLALLYRLLWRLTHEPQVRHDPLDPDILRARQMSKQVGHDIHKMRAFVRFRQVADGGEEPLHVAWFEPAHRIVEANAPWFQRRFANMRWAILTPDASVRWDLKELTVGPGADRQDAPAADAGEALWLTYYRHIFNPARLKLDMMRKEMPCRYWHNLPEAVLIGELATRAQERSGRMVEDAPTQPMRRIVPIEQKRDPPVDGLDALRAQVMACRDCPGATAATQAVNGVGPLGARLMLVGEQPGDHEDLRGAPFVGPAGQLLARALAQAGVAGGEVFMTNAVRHFHFEPRGKRRIHKTPGQREVAACSHWLEKEIGLVQPRALVALGATAARALLGRPVAVTRERGEWQARPDGLPVFVTLHPSALLRMPGDARAKEFDLFARDLARAYILSRDFAQSSRDGHPDRP